MIINRILGTFLGLLLTVTTVFAADAPSNAPVNLQVQHMIMEITQQSVEHAVSNHYRLGGQTFNMKKGIYRVDCSEYVDHILRIATPDAYQVFKRQTDTSHPISNNYYDFFNALPTGKVHHDWYRVPQVSALKPGDILVFRYKNTWRRNADGHVMIIVDHPQPEHRHKNVYLVRVADAAPSGHTHDTRPRHTSGIGMGTLMLETNPDTGTPVAYAWKLDAPWEHDVWYAMARPM